MMQQDIIKESDSSKLNKILKSAHELGVVKSNVSLEELIEFDNALKLWKI